MSLKEEFCTNGWAELRNKSDGSNMHMQGSIYLLILSRSISDHHLRFDSSNHKNQNPALHDCLLLRLTILQVTTVTLLDISKVPIHCGTDQKASKYIKNLWHCHFYCTDSDTCTFGSGSFRPITISVHDHFGP